MTEIKACGIVLCALVVCIVFKKLQNEYSLFVRLGITVSITLVSLAIIYPVLSYIDEIAKKTIIYNHIPILIKALGIAFAVQITSDICKDAGENGLGERICFFGRVELIVISLPLIKSMFELCERLME